MAEPHPFEDEASLYLLGELGREEREAFEARMKVSPELRSLVRELEAGAVALAMASTPRQPPAQTWEDIRGAVRAESEDKVATPSFGWVRSGWAAAACFLIGWLIYALWTNHSDSASDSAANIAGDVSTTASKQLEAVQQETLRLLPQPQSPKSITTPESPNPLSKVGEIALLRHQVRELEDQIVQLSQVLTQQQTLSLESGQVTFFNLVPPGADAADRSATRPSAELQRALLMAIARELGKKESSQQQEAKSQTDDTNPARVSDSVIDFVDVPLDGSEEPSKTETDSRPQKQLPTTAQVDASPSIDTSNPKPSKGAIAAAYITDKSDKTTTLVALDSTDTPIIDVSVGGSQKSIPVKSSTTVMAFPTGQPITLSAGGKIFGVIPASSKVVP